MSETSGPTDFGRVDADGTVYVRTSDGERVVGQVPDVTPDEAMAFFARRFQTLDTEVGLIEARIANGALSPDEARRSIAAARHNIVGANAVGDLDSLLIRLDALSPTLDEQAEARRAERAKAAEAARDAKEAMVAEAERLAQGNDWRGGVNRFRSLLEEWKALPRIDRTTDDALWHRFSAARTTYTRRRKAQFAEQSEKRESARQIKEQIISEARELASSTDWGATAAAFRDLMSRWKAAGAAPREVEDKLWAEFRGIQDDFFSARASAASEQDAELGANLKAKQALLDEAEAAILPVKDLTLARSQFRDFLNRYNQQGHVPRDAMRALEGRVRTLEQAVRSAEETEWRRTDPDAKQRALETVTMFTNQIAKLQAQADAHEKAGNTRKAKEERDSIATYKTWLSQAQANLDEFTA